MASRKHYYVPRAPANNTYTVRRCRDTRRRCASLAHSVGILDRRLCNLRRATPWDLAMRERLAEARTVLLAASVFTIEPAPPLQSPPPAP